MNKRMLADALWDAANVRLWDGVALRPEGSDCAMLGKPCGQRQYSCDAVADEIFPIPDFLERLGCRRWSTECFSDYEEGEKRQGVRYMWLLLAMYVAEDEGVTL